jgi:predicted metal-dependent peptidase
MNSIQTMLIDTRINLPYYGTFNLHINFIEQESIGTCAVNVTSKGMNFYYSPTFLNGLSQKETSFIVLHENFHLLFDHPKRTVSGLYDHKLSNIVQDMIINHIIWEDIVTVNQKTGIREHTFVEIPKDKEGRNMALFVPAEYDGKLIFEELYMWMKEKKDEWQKQNKNCSSCNGSGKNQEQGQESQDCSDCNGSGKNQDGQNQGQDGQDGQGQKSYGPYGKNPSNEGGKTIDTWSIDQIFQDLENGTGEYLDKHISDDVPEEMREAMMKDVMDRLEARGLTAGNLEETMNKLRKKRKDYLREIKRSVSNMIFGSIKQKTIVKPNRRQIMGLKGNRKIKSKVNVILDVSGSMHGLVEKVLNYVYRNDIEINLIQADTQVNSVENLKSGKKLELVKLVGFGGTVLNPAIQHTKNHFNEFNTVILTDGYCDHLDLSGLKGKVLIISAGVKVPISRSNGKLKQIIIEE